MDLCCVHAKGNETLLRRSFSEKPLYCGSGAHPMVVEIRVSKGEASSSYCRYRSVLIKAVGKKNPGDSGNSNSNSSPASGDGLKGNSNKFGDDNSHKSQHRPLDWREFRAYLYIKEQSGTVDYVHNQDKNPPARPKPLPHKWAHPISAPENGCLLVATEKLDGVRTFECTVVLLLRSGTQNPQEGPYGIIINGPLDKKMKHMNPNHIELGTTFADCSLQFGGPLNDSMFLMRANEGIRPLRFDEVIPGLYFGSRNSLDEASALVKKGALEPRDFKFFMGYAGWQMDQLIEEIESNYWYVVACSANLIFQNSSSDDLWGEILQLMGGVIQS